MLMQDSDKSRCNFCKTFDKIDPLKITKLRCRRQECLNLSQHENPANLLKIHKHMIDGNEDKAIKIQTRHFNFQEEDLNW